MEISEGIYKWIKGWSKFEPDSMYGQGYRDAMRDVLEEIEEDNDIIRNKRKVRET